MSLSVSTVLQILQAKKAIKENLKWRPVDGGPSNGWRLNARFQTEAGEWLLLRGNVRVNYSFALIYKDKPIRKYTVHGGKHSDPRSKKAYAGPHKHTWDEVYEDRCCYEPDDISTSDINQAFLDFLKECNIRLDGNYEGCLFDAIPFSERN